MLNELGWVWREARRRPGRTGWMAVGYAVSVAVAAAGFALFGETRRETDAALRVTGAHFLGFILTDGSSSDDPRPHDPVREGLEAYGHPTALLSRSDIDAIRRLPLVRRAAPWLSFRMQWPADRNRTVLVGGFDPADMETVRMAGCSATEIVAGRGMKPGDAGGVLIEQTFAETAGLSVGHDIELAGRTFAVLGMLSPGTRPAKADLYLALPDAVAVIESRLTGPLDGRVNGVLVDGRDARRQSGLIANVQALLGPHAATGGYGCFGPAGAAMGLGGQGMALLALLLAAGVAVSVARTQYALLLERRREIGIVKAIGWSDRQVGRHALWEAAIPSALGGIAGAAVAGLTAGAGGPAAAVPAALALVGGVAGGAALYAARSMARISPADVLRKR